MLHRTILIIAIAFSGLFSSPGPTTYESFLPAYINTSTISSSIHLVNSSANQANIIVSFYKVNTSIISKSLSITVPADSFTEITQNTVNLPIGEYSAVIYSDRKLDTSIEYTLKQTPDISSKWFFSQDATPEILFIGGLSKQTDIYIQYKGSESTQISVTLSGNIVNPVTMPIVVSPGASHKIDLSTEDSIPTNFSGWIEINNDLLVGMAINQNEQGFEVISPAQNFQTNDELSISYKTGLPRVYKEYGIEKLSSIINVFTPDETTNTVFSFSPLESSTITHSFHETLAYGKNIMDAGSLSTLPPHSQIKLGISSDRMVFIQDFTTSPSNKVQTYHGYMSEKIGLPIKWLKTSPHLLYLYNYGDNTSTVQLELGYPQGITEPISILANQSICIDIGDYFNLSEKTENVIWITSDNPLLYTLDIIEYSLLPEEMASLSINLSGPTTAAVGEEITYQIQVINTSANYARKLKIENILPNNAVYVSGGTHKNGRIYWNIDELQPYSSTTVTYRVISSQTITNSDYGVDALNAPRIDGIGVVRTIISSAPTPRLSLDITGPTSASPNETVSFEITIQNTGNASANNLTIQNFIPPTAIFLSANQNGQLIGDYVTWTLGSLSPNSSQTFSFSIKAMGHVIFSHCQVEASGGFTTTSSSVPLLFVEQNRIIYLPILIR